MGGEVTGDMGTGGREWWSRAARAGLRLCAGLVLAACASGGEGDDDPSGPGIPPQVARDVSGSWSVQLDAGDGSAPITLVVDLVQADLSLRFGGTLDSRPVTGSGTLAGTRLTLSLAVGGSCGGTATVFGKLESARNAKGTFVLSDCSGVARGSSVWVRSADGPVR